jgi:hypothetical protein
MRDHLASLGLHVTAQSSTLSYDFFTLLTATYLIVSISSFAWWAAFLGDARCVVLPDYGLMKVHHWKPRPDIKVLHDLTLRDGRTSDELAGLAHITAAERRQLDGNVIRAGLWQFLASQLHMLTSDDPAAEETTIAAVKDAAARAGIHVADKHPSLVQSLERTAERVSASVSQESNRVVRLQQNNLRRWDGDFRHTMESLFD